MSLIQVVLRYLEENNVHYTVRRDTGEPIGPYRVATLLLEDAQGQVLLAYPSNRGIDISEVRRISHRRLEFAEAEAYHSVMKDSTTELLPPLGQIWGIPTLVDKTIASWPHFEFALDDKLIVQIMTSSLADIFPGRIVHQFSVEPPGRSTSNLAISNESVQQLLDRASMKTDNGKLLELDVVMQRINDANSLPVVSGMVQQIIRILGNPDSNVGDLAELIEQDQALSAKLVKLARSPKYTTEMQVKSVNDAIYRVVGFDEAMRMALAMIFSRQFQGPMDGRVGMKSIWEQSVTLAITSRYIARKTALNQFIVPGIMYAAALLHNIGYLAISHLFPREFGVYNQLATSMQDTPLRELESGLFEITPLSASVLVMAQWKMPQEFVDVAQYAAEGSIGDMKTGYVDCMHLTQEFINNGDFSQLSGSAQKIVQMYGIDIVALEAQLQQDDVAAEVPFLVDLMLG